MLLSSKPADKKVRTLISRTEQNQQQGIDPANKPFNASHPNSQVLLEFFRKRKTNPVISTEP
jgi:hypothetical protein